MREGKVGLRTTSEKNRNRKSYNRLSKQHNPRLHEILLNQRLQMHRLLIDLTMQCPILGLVPHALRFPLQQNRRIRLRDCEQSHDPKERTHDQSDPRSPSPAEMTTRDELADDGSGDWTDECRACESCSGDSSVQSVPEINVSASYDCDGCGAETTA